jgi:hypothetical protein
MIPADLSPTTSRIITTVIQLFLLGTIGSVVRMIIRSCKAERQARIYRDRVYRD